jgi:hypothetical protein
LCWGIGEAHEIINRDFQYYAEVIIVSSNRKSIETIATFGVGLKFVGG